jgi:hypothetical protein
MRPIATVALLCLVVTAGCVGSLGGDGGADGPTQTPTTTAGPAPPDATAANTVQFGNLSEDQRRAFRAARYDPVAFAPDERFSIGDVSTFRSHEYVRYEGRYYAIETRSRMGPMASTWGAELLSSEPNATVRRFESLSQPLKNVVATAATGGSYRVGYGEDPPEGLYDLEYVRYDNDTYRIFGERVMDSPEWVLTVTAV